MNDDNIQGTSPPRVLKDHRSFVNLKIIFCDFSVPEQ